jgi:type 1 glutamine amidotransferase
MSRGIVLTTVLCLTVSCGESTATAPVHKRFRALVFTKTTGFRHTSIDEGARAIRTLGRTHRFSVDTTADPRRFTRANLARYDVVVFMSTTGTPIARRSRQRAFEAYIAKGGGFVGVHAAADTRGKWPWYERLLGARFKNHDAGTPTRTVTVEDTSSAATRGLPANWTRADEWYRFRTDPRPRVHVLVSLDRRPLAWCHDYDGGRAVYTAMGHTEASFAEPEYLRHLLGAIEMAAGRARFACAP